MFRPNQEIGLYTLIKRIGRGGFGEVWLAERRAKFVTTKVAVKLPLEEQVDTEVIKQEAVLWEQASGHPNVLPIIDADEYDGQVVIVSEFAPDGSLEELLKKTGILPIKKAVELAIGILSGLEFLHSKKIIHRDLKPANILLQGETPRLADFGISRVMKTTSVSVNMSGTPSYMAPEAFDRKRNAQTDIWSVGVILYQMIKGSLPFPHDNMTDLLGALFRNEPESLPDYVPPSLREIVLKALAKDPQERYHSAHEMRNDLTDFLIGISRQNTQNAPQAEQLPPTISSEHWDKTLPFDRIDLKQASAKAENFIHPPETNKTPSNQMQSKSTGDRSLPDTVRQQDIATVQLNKLLNDSRIEIKKPNSKSSFIKVLTLVVVLLFGSLLTASYLIYQQFFSDNQIEGNTRSNSIKSAFENTKLSSQDMEWLLEDTSPEMLKQLSQNSEAKKELRENVRELFALAIQAEKEGIAEDIDVKRELENIETEVLATNYDKIINKDKGPMPPFGFISEDRVKQFWEDKNLSNEEEFKKFFDAKTKMFKENSPEGKEPEITEEQRKQAREYFAKTRIYAAEAEAKKGAADSGLPEDFFKKVELQNKLQKAQFLARLYSQKVLAEKTKITDEEIKKYIEQHPELPNKEEKKAKAQEILKRVKGGEDFAKLAEEFSEDPGSKNKGGLYENITEGAFVPEFEKAVFSLQPGQIYPELVESSFGYHIIKAEKFGENKGADGQTKKTFDARHILISTMFKDPENPMGRDIPVEDYIKEKLQKEKEEKILEEIKKNNPVEVAEDFTIPEPPSEPTKQTQKNTNKKTKSNKK